MKKSQLAILIAVIVLCACGVFGYVNYKNNNEKPKDNTEQKEEEKEKKEEENIVETPTNTESVESTPIKGNDDRIAWKTDARNNNNVVTIIGTTWCPNCQVYEPIVQEVKDEYNLNVYFFKVDILTAEESNDLMNTFVLTDYRGAIPYTAVISKGEVTANHTGRMTKESLIDFLKDAKVIK